MHFFTEPTLLNPHTPAQEFGPVVGDENNKYNISSLHTVSAKAKIFACQDAMMLVQPAISAVTGVATGFLYVFERNRGYRVLSVENESESVIPLVYNLLLFINNT